MNTPLFGLLAIAVYTGLIAGADAITKLISAGYAPAQLYALSGLLVAGFCGIVLRLRKERDGLAVRCARAMALRSGATVLACLCYFYAFRLLPLAEVFVFVAMMPVLAALLSGWILRETLRPLVWAAVVVATAGLMMTRMAAGPVQGDAPSAVFGVFGAISSGMLKDPGTLFAFGGVLFGTLSIVIARYIGQRENKALAQVFYPNLALGLSMLVVLPFVWQPMPLVDLGWVLGYAALLFAARWLMVLALAVLPAYAVVPLLNLQFAWVALIGFLAFGERPLAETVLGMMIVAGAGGVLIWEQARLAPSLRRNAQGRP